ERWATHNWKMEGYLLGCLLVFVVTHTVGYKINERYVSNWVDYMKDYLLRSQFFKFGVSPNNDNRIVSYIRDNDQLYTTYCTGRVNIKGFIIRLRLKARQNFILYIVQQVFSFFFESLKPDEDAVEINGTFHDNISVNSFIFAIVNKNKMNERRNENYSLSLTRTIDSPKLPNEFVFMSESAEINEAVLNKAEVLDQLAKVGDVLQYLIISDQPTYHPTTIDECKSRPSFALKLSLKSSSNGDLEKSKDSIEILLKVIDLISNNKRFEIRPEVFKKINNVRKQQVEKIIKKIELQKKEELEEKKLEEQKKIKDELKKSSPAELEKFEKLQKAKKERRMKNKQRIK
ncbi:uncharacterized protein ASCRUDRAFT_23029, partial [Ascoidea rubescens DSM 1968]